MNAQEIKDVLEVRDIIAANTSAAETIAALVDWKNGAPVVQQDHSVAEDAVARVESKPEPVAAPAKKAPAKAAAKGRAKPPVADDDDADF